jgi:Protein of unknown function (DUF3027)
MGSVTTVSRAPKLDTVLAEAVEVARSALMDSGDDVRFGDHLGTVAEADRVVTHFFAATSAGYRGWRWAVTLARAPRQRVATVDEVVLLPGDQALLAPAWVPWKDRMDKRDLRPGDLVPVSDDDPRLVPGYLVGDEVLDATSARELREVITEVGLGREWVLSVGGRDAAAKRWYAGEHGPDSPIAAAAPARCATCGFLVRLGGPLSAAFGVCGNSWSPSDGQVVSLDHGCGAHSDVRAEQSSTQTSATPVHDTLTWDTFADADVEVISH